MPNTTEIKTEYALTLSFLKNVTASAAREIISKRPTLQDFLDSPPAEFYATLREGLFDNPILNAITRAKEQIALCEKEGVQIISYFDSGYPYLLKDIDYPPTILFVKGKLAPPDSESIAIVGTRRCTSYGRLTAERYAAFFARKGIITTSGMAYGIDRSAHGAVIDAGGVTYAVIASGIDCISPAEANKMADKIVESGGAIISEYPCGTIARPGYFPRRNRIISGLSSATVVVESGMKGGALITAQFAFDQNRELFAVPGRITDEKSVGCNTLIKKDMACPTLSPEDVLERLGVGPATGDHERDADAPAPTFANATEKLVWDAIGFDPIHVDQLSMKTGLEISELLVVLLKMEFQNLLRQLPGKHYVRS